MLADATQHVTARKWLSADVSLWDIPTEDLWARDAGPLFAFQGDALVVSHIQFNGWGDKQQHRHDGQVAARVADRLGLPLIDSGLKGEPGGVEHDGHGLLMAHESSWVNANRNPGLTRAEIEARLGIDDPFACDGRGAFELGRRLEDRLARKEGAFQRAFAASIAQHPPADQPCANHHRRHFHFGPNDPSHRVGRKSEGGGELLPDRLDLAQRQARAALAIGKIAVLAPFAGACELRDAFDQSLQADILALDALVAVVSGDNPVATMSTPTLRLMLEGRVVEWPELLTGRFGIEPEPLQLHLPKTLLTLGRIWPFKPIVPATEAMRYRDPNRLADAVAADPGALGIVPLSRIGNATPLVLAGPCGRVLPATAARVKAEDYPLVEPVFIQRLDPVQPRLVRDFIAYAQSAE